MRLTVNRFCSKHNHLPVESCIIRYYSNKFPFLVIFLAIKEFSKRQNLLKIVYSKSLLANAKSVTASIPFT